MQNTINFERYDPNLMELGIFFREIAAQIDENPDAILQYVDYPKIKNICCFKGQSRLDKVKMYEALSYGDAGVLLALPGASLAGSLMDELGNENQQKAFYSYVNQTNARTFLAVTEPGCGSNLNRLETHIKTDLTKENLFNINGEKWLVGHGATGGTGIVIVKIAKGPLGVVAVWLMPETIITFEKNAGLIRTALPMIGLRGARLGRLIFKNVLINEESILGNHLRIASRGMMALIKAFNSMRPCVGAMALGVAQAMVDYVFEIENPFVTINKNILKKLNTEITITRNLLHQAARHFDYDPFDSYWSSLAKVKATMLAEKIAEIICNMLGKHSFIEYPLIKKWYRDVWGFEYMEGTQHMQKMNVYHAMQKKYISQDLSVSQKINF